MAEEGPREWSPGRRRGEVQVKILANLGDAHLFDYGGHIVYRVRDPKKSGPHATWIAVDYWDEPIDDKYLVYRWDIPRDVAKEYDWVDWKALADYHNMSKDAILSWAKSQDIQSRALLIGDIGHYYGLDNLDSYPLQFTRKELEERWPEFA